MQKRKSFYLELQSGRLGARNSEVDGSKKEEVSSELNWYGLWFLARSEKETT
jgi:hypothetical protein